MANPYLVGPRPGASGPLELGCPIAGWLQAPSDETRLGRAVTVMAHHVQELMKALYAYRAALDGWNATWSAGPVDALSVQHCQRALGRAARNYTGGRDAFARLHDREAVAHMCISFVADLPKMPFAFKGMGTQTLDAHIRRMESVHAAQVMDVFRDTIRRTSALPAHIIDVDADESLDENIHGDVRSILDRETRERVGRDHTKLQAEKRALDEAARHCHAQYYRDDRVAAREARDRSAAA